MKIGILTFHHVDNYGAVLQAYALQRFLKEIGHDVETIDHRPISAVNHYMKGLSPLSKSLRLNSFSIEKLLRAWKIRCFMRKHIKLSKPTIYQKKSLSRISNRYDAVIVGSDQVWCLDSFRGFDSSFFFDFIEKSTIKISYAASFGHTVCLGKHQDEVCNLVNQFESIMVRDSNSRDILSKECGKESEIVLDPTFLVDYENLTRTESVPSNYLLIYNGDPLKPEEEDLVRKICSVKNLQVVSVRNHNSIADKNFLTADPSQWLSLFQSASYIVTNTYHGSVFSLIYQKQFTVFYSAHKTNKTLDLLRGLNLESRMILNQEKISVESQLERINYKDVQARINSKIVASKSALEKALLK